MGLPVVFCPAICPRVERLCCCIKILELGRPNQRKPRPHFLLSNLFNQVKSIPSLAWHVTPTVNEGNGGLVCFFFSAARREGEELWFNFCGYPDTFPLDFLPPDTFPPNSSP